MRNEVNVFAQVCNTARVAGGGFCSENGIARLILAIMGDEVASVRSIAIISSA